MKTFGQKANWSNASYPVALCANGGIGDQLIAFPVLCALAKIFSRRLQIICTGGFPDAFFRGIPAGAFCEIRMGKRRAMQYNLKMLKKKIPQCDLFLMAETWHRPEIDQLLEHYSPKSSIGYGPQFQHPIRKVKSPHRMDVLFEVPRAINPSFRLETFAKPPANFAKLARLFRQKMPVGMKALGLHVDSKSNKIWPRPLCEEFLDRFLQRHPDFLVFILGKGRYQQWSKRHGPRVIQCPSWPITYALSFVGALDFFVGVDSCMLHSADLFRVPGVGLYGPTNPAEWGFRLTRHRHLYGNGSMAAIQPTSVLDALESLL